MIPPVHPSVAAKLSPGFDRSTILRLLGTYGTIVVLVVMLVVFALAEPGTFATETSATF
jgi:ribose transport system permease protein